MSSNWLQAGLPPANDRMLTTLFLAVLLHAIVILGVTFSPPFSHAHGRQTPGLEVILVGNQEPAVAHNRNAKYLAQRNQRGSGNTLAAKRALIPKSSPAPADRPGVAGGAGLAFRQSGSGSGGESLIATQGPTTKILYLSSAEAAKEAAQLPLRLENRPNYAMRSNDDGVELRLRGKGRRQLWIAADTRASQVAEYLDGWRRKVERVGTLHFPNAARLQKHAQMPIVEVTIDADGRLAHAIVRRSSGHPEIDDAAIRILTLAAPFAPFPRGLAAKHDAIRIAYEWEFLSGATRASSVLYSEPQTQAGTP